MTATLTVTAASGDAVEVSGRRVGDAARRGEILEVLGPPGRPHFRVRWDDGHESVLYPGEATTVHPRRVTAYEPAAVTRALVEPLREEGVELELLPHRRTLRAEAEARALGVLAQTVAKTVLVRDDEGRCIRAVVPADARLSLERLASALDAASVRLLTETELLSTYPQFELGAVPPFGGPAGDVVVVDRRLAECEHVVLEAGVHDTSLRLRCDDLIRIADARLAEIATA